MTRDPEGAIWGRIFAGVALAFLSCGEPRAAEAPTPSFAQEIPPASAPRDHAVLVVDGFGEIEIELLPDLAPATTAHFVGLAERGFYDGTTFHRVVPGFMIQGGDPNSRDRDPRNDGLGGQEEHVPDERPALAQRRGLVSLANSGVPNSGGSQFFILVADTPHLDGAYAAFGHVVRGMDVVDRIATVERDVYGRHGPTDRPVQNVVVSRVRIERAKRDAPGSAAP